MLESIANHAVNWQEQGFYRVEVETDAEDSQVKVTNKIMNLSAFLDPNRVGQDAQEIKSKMISNNFTQIGAYIPTAVDLYKLADCCQAARRNLKRNHSGANPITAHVPPGRHIKPKVVAASPSPSGGAADDSSAPFSPSPSPPAKGKGKGPGFVIRVNPLPDDAADGGGQPDAAAASSGASAL